MVVPSTHHYGKFDVRWKWSPFQRILDARVEELRERGTAPYPVLEHTRYLSGVLRSLRWKCETGIKKMRSVFPATI